MPTNKPVIYLHYLYDFMEMEMGAVPLMWPLLREGFAKLEERYGFRLKWKLSKVIDQELERGGADIVLIDYGGLSVAGGGWMDYYTRALYRAFMDHPSTIYIVASDVTRWAVEDAMAHLPEQHNLRFLDDDWLALEVAVKEILGVK